MLCTARALGEFGAVSVVSGHIRGQTNTLPLHVEILYNEYNYSGAFAVASLLAAVAVIALILKKLLELKIDWKNAVEDSPATRKKEFNNNEYRRHATSAKNFGNYEALRDVQPAH